VANAHWLNSNIVHGKIERRAKSVLDFARLFLPNKSVITEVNYATCKKIEIQKQKESKETAIDGTAKTVDGSEELKFLTQRLRRVSAQGRTEQTLAKFVVRFVAATRAFRLRHP
jgi:hypothetical protein